MYYAARDHLNIYHSAACLARYTPTSASSTSPSDISGHFYASLASVVHSQPMLRVGIANTSNANTAYFTYLPSINLESHVRVTTVSAATEAAFAAESARIQAQAHGEKWQDLETTSPWRLVIVRSDSDAIAFEDIIFVFHHSLLDGMSAKLFHKHLLTALNTISTTDDSTPHKLTFTAAPDLPLGQEDTVPATMSLPFMLRTLWSELAPSYLKPKPTPIWAAKDVTLSVPNITRLIPVDISAADTKQLLAACKSHNTTLTALLHALILSLLSRRFPSSKFTCATPMSLRPYSSDPKSETLRNLITTHHTDLSASTDIWSSAAHIRSDFAARLASLPANDVTMLTKYVSNWNDFLRKKDGSPRNGSWEISNVGVLSPGAAAADAGDAKYKITRVLFSNAGMPTGAAIGVNVVSVADGPLGISLSWQKDIVDDELVEYVASGLRKLVDGFCARGEFSLDDVE